MYYNSEFDANIYTCITVNCKVRWYVIHHT